MFDGKPLIRPWVTDRHARPEYLGHTLQSLPGEAVTLGPAVQAAHPQALQPTAERAEPPARLRDGVVVEPALTDPPKPRATLPDVVMPTFAENLLDARQGGTWTDT